MNYREAGKTSWETKSGIGADRDEIKIGAIQRIADACELMAKNHSQLMSDRDWYKRQYEDRGKRIETLNRQNASLRGVITKLKRQPVAEGR